LVISRQLLGDFCAQLLQLDDVTAKQVAHFTLEKVQARVISFEEQVTKFCITTNLNRGMGGMMDMIIFVK